MTVVVGSWFGSSLQVAEVRHINSADEAAGIGWAADHPHVRVWQRPGNTVYIAQPRSALAPGRPGAGVFRLTGSTRLTKPQATASVWQLPSAFAPYAGHMTYRSLASFLHVISGVLEAARMGGTARNAGQLSQCGSASIGPGRQ